MAAPDLILPTECVTPESFNAWFTYLNDRIELMNGADGFTTGKTTILSSGTISAPAGATIVVSARSATLRAYVSAHVGSTATITIVNSAGTPDATPTIVDWVVR